MKEVIMQNIEKEEMVEVLYSEILNRLEAHINKLVEEKITEILYSPILEDKEWPRKKRT
ncbi:MAG: hypothetical protein ACRDD8_05420 [Bacteroidales bacterium]